MSRSYALIWDAPNMDMGLGAILGGRPTAAYRPRFDAIGRWVVLRAMEIGAEPLASVFTNVAPGGAYVIRPWVEAIRNVGFSVFPKPKTDDECNVYQDLIAYILDNRDELAALVVAPADG